MLTSYRDDYLTRSLKRNEKTDDLRRNLKKKRTTPTKSLTKGKRCNEQVTTEWSSGHTVLFACSGIAVQRVGCVTRFLTTASLVKALNDKRRRHDNLKIEVRYEDNVVVGFLGEYNFDHNIAAVNVENIPDICIIPFSNIVTNLLSHCRVISLGRDILGKLMVTNGKLNGSQPGSWYQLMLSTCKISKAYEGGPLFDFDGKFVGMNLSISMEGTVFLPTLRVLDQALSCKSLREIKFPGHIGESLTGENSNSLQEVHANALINEMYGDLESLGYPERPESVSNDDMVLVNNFEDNFGDMCGTGVWSELSEAVAKNVQENTVALASFNGERRHFACTGFFIDWNGSTTILTSASLLRNSGYEDKIIENLKIDVLLSNGQHAEGKLQHYNLHYNVALVGVKESSCAPQPAKIEHHWHRSCEFVAVGRNFTSGGLMGAKGIGFPTLVKHDCRFLLYTTCRIIKAGIGGPLLAFDGKFEGMNFYDEGAGGTPFLSCNAILNVLMHFKTKGTVDDVGHDTYQSHVLDWTIAGDNSVCINSHCGVDVMMWMSAYMKFESEDARPYLYSCFELTTLRLQSSHYYII